jgi:hypothetical protein
MKKDYVDQLNKVFAVQEQILDIHPFLEKVFPIAIVTGGQFMIYEPDTTCKQYILVKQVATPMPVPQGVRAAFPLEEFDNRMVCVISGEIFEEQDGYVTIFHEFMHCQQFEMCEQKLKQTLGIVHKAQAENDPMWEINHPFPYSAPDFVAAYQPFLEENENRDLGEVMEGRRWLKSFLSEGDFEYMVWQEWKEGFARLIENQIRRRMGLPENFRGKEQPLDRVVFYVGGANFIEYLGRRAPQLLIDIESLFDRMIRA